MPIYEYRCATCGARFETLARRGDLAPECPRCGGGGVEKLFSTFAVATSGDDRPSEPGPCGACGAPQRGLCAQ
jgi:putative FmdB family regulatory protein